MKPGISPLMRVENVSRIFPVGSTLLGGPRHRVRALDRVSLDLRRGETLGLVGESGCGKSTLARLMVALDAPSEGRITFDNAPLSGLPAGELHRRRRQIQMIFQDPYASLNPRMTARASIAEPLANFTGMGRADIEARIEELAAQVGLPPHLLDRFPHELSGGQCQRVGIARAISAGPDVIIADEPVSALDVSIQAQILNLLLEIKRRMGLSMVFVSHDLSVVSHIADRVAVMYLGRIVEIGPTAEIFAQPRHPYTRMLLDAVPHPLPAGRGRKTQAQGELPSPIDPPAGCHFRSRCPHADASLCGATVPPLVTVGEAEIACLRLDEITLERAGV